MFIWFYLQFYCISINSLLFSCLFGVFVVSVISFRFFSSSLVLFTWSFFELAWSFFELSSSNIVYNKSNNPFLELLLIEMIFNGFLILTPLLVPLRKNND